MIALIDEEYMPGERESTRGCFHVPVLLRETVSALQPAAGKIFLDATVGGGDGMSAGMQNSATLHKGSLCCESECCWR